MTAAKRSKAPGPNLSVAPPSGTFAIGTAASLHSAQFYDDEDRLLAKVTDLVIAALASGDRVVLIATSARLRALAGRVAACGYSPSELQVVDAQLLLPRLLNHGSPTAERLGVLLSALRAGPENSANTGRRTLVYSELTDLLTRAGDAAAAVELEALWNDACSEHSLSLVCACALESFTGEGSRERFFDLCQQHAWVTPAEPFPRLDDRNACLRDICAIQQRVRHLEREGDRAEASDAVKELFLAILGHDLRGPLSTVLASARVLGENPELPETARHGVERILRSGERMRRLVAQLLDAASARQPGGVPVVLGPERDLRPLVARMVDEVRASNGNLQIEHHDNGPVLACFDADRLEQVVSNLLGNAVAHGDPNRPIQIWVEGDDAVAQLCVHNHGTPIPPEFLGLLFDPFKRARGKRDASGGLGLGLYIAERIMSAHGGSIEVWSTLEDGTRFEARLPRSVHGGLEQ
jgi:signal transduction histidine kinase